jgi:hypothetical protein
MKKSSMITKLGLRLTVSSLASFASFAALDLSETANAAPRQYYHAAPEWNHTVPSEIGNGDYGPYPNHLSPNGTLTGPIATDANGGG